MEIQKINNVITQALPDGTTRLIHECMLLNDSGGLKFYCDPACQFEGLHEEAINMIAMGILCAPKDKYLVVYSARDGKHSDLSRHYIGMAVDFRTLHLDDDEIRQFVEDMNTLCPYCNIIKESSHIHCQYNGYVLESGR